MFDSELRNFKTGIDLRAYAASHGYMLDSKESWRGSAVMRDARGDKIIIKRDPDGVYQYFSVRDDRDNGTIIDFVQNRQRLILGAVRKELRPWIGQPQVPVPSFAPLQATAKDRLRVEANFARATDAERHLYLEQERAIPSALLGSARFRGRIRIDGRGNAVFPHYDGNGLCGFEIKNKGFTGFSTGGSKGLFLSHEQPFDNCIVFCESAIDALSHAFLFPNTRARYASIGGKPNPVQPELIRAAIKRLPKYGKVIAAMDADVEGGKLADVVREAFQLSARDDLIFVFQQPVGYKDWNDMLRGRARLPLPSGPEELSFG
jgi:hypothetical protein